MVSYYARLFAFFLITSAMVRARSCVCQETPVNLSPNIGLNDMGAVVSPERPARKRKKCCPYDFDGKMCKIVGNRVLCGYNRNVGMPNNDETRDLKNGCRIRANRLECGYNEGLFTNPPRPPLLDSHKVNKDNVVVNSDQTPERLVDARPATISFNYGTTTGCENIEEKIVCTRIYS